MSSDPEIQVHPTYRAVSPPEKYGPPKGYGPKEATRERAEGVLLAMLDGAQSEAARTIAAGLVIIVHELDATRTAIVGALDRMTSEIAGPKITLHGGGK